MRYDLIVVGGGLVGASLVLALQDLGKKIALIDARLPSKNDPRLLALNDSSCRFLANLGLWEPLAPHAAPIHQVHVSHRGRFGSVRLKREDANLSSLGFVVPAYIIEQTLHAKLNACSQVTFYRPARLTALTQNEELATLTLQQENTELVLQSPLVIGADGTDSTVRKQLGIETAAVDYQQSAIVTRTRIKGAHHQIAYERFTEDGAIAMLPLLNNECATIWTASHTTINYLLQLSEQDFLQALQKEFGHRLGQLQAVAERHTYPLRMVQARKAFLQHVLLLGNAAHTLHPIAAQGFNLALYETAIVIDYLKGKTSMNESLTAADLQKIGEKIAKQQTISVGVSHRLAQLFDAAKQSSLISIARQLGMVAFDTAAPLKKHLILSLLGKTKKAPSLLLGKNK